MAMRLETEKFTGKNDYGLWKMKMRAVLIEKGLAAVLAPGKGAALDEKAQAKFDEMQMKAHSAIILCLSDKVLREVQEESTATGILARLDEIYLAKSLANRLYLKKRLYSYSFAVDRSIVEQLEDFNKIIDDLGSVDVKITDEDKAILVLNALPSSYDQLSDAIIYGRDKPITYAEVQSALMAKEMQRGASKAGDQPIAESLNVKRFKKQKGKKKFDEFKSPSTEGKETRSCHWCKKPGHLKKDCFAWKRKQAAEGGKAVNTAECAEEDEISHALSVMEPEEGGLWIMDSGASFHMTSNLGWFEEIAERRGSVILGNNQVCSIQGVGTIRMRLNDGSVRLFCDVRYIPDIKRNLISLGVLEKKGCMIVFIDGKMVVSRGGKELMHAERRGSLYYMESCIEKKKFDELNSVAECSLRSWHNRLGHPAVGSVVELVKLGILQGVDVSDQSPCEECVLGKSKKLPYPKGKHTSSKPLDYAHSDLWGPAQEKSIGGGRYYMTVIDDFSRKMWLYILKEKSEAFNRFREWCSEVEREKGCSLGCFRTDNGLEFLSGEFDSFCKNKGIRRHKTVPLNPQQNGVAERANRTIVERVRCMLLAAGMEKKFWAEAAATAVKLINKCPSSSINGDTPDFRWYGKHTDYSELRTFGCRAFAHVKQGKLEPRAVKCVMLGYQSGVKGYRLWCTELGRARIVISRDVVFWEQEMPYRKRVSEEAGEKVAVQPEVESGNDVDEHTDDGTASSAGARQSGTTAPAPDDLATYQLARDRVRRQPKLPAKYSDCEMLYYALFTAEEVEFSEPGSYNEAMQGKESDSWMRAMIEEIESLLKNGTWILVEKADGRRVVSCKWIFKKKLEGSDGDKIRFKARLVARGFTQEHGVDYNEVFSPVVKHTSIRILLAIVAKRNWELEQLDVKTAFLHGDLEETIYMAQPEGFVRPGDEGKVCLLKKSIYGLKQASRQWHKKFDDHMIKTGFQRSKYDECVYFKKEGGVPVAYLLLYVDDMLLAGSTKESVNKVKDDLAAAFEMKDLGPAKRILGMSIIRNRDRGEIWLLQTDYISRLLKRFNMEGSKQVSVPMSQQYKLTVEQRPKSEAERDEMRKIPYANIIGSVMYAMISTRPDIAQAVSVTSRYMSEHGKEHWSALKWLLKYLKGAGNLGILFRADSSYEGDALRGYCDSDFAGNLDNRRSQTGYLFTLFGSIVSWKSKLQSVVALSTTEAEFLALTAAVKESFWLKGILADFGIEQKAVAIGCDNNSALCLAKHQVYHERSKHIDVRLHFIREEIEKGNVKVFKVSTDDNPTDMLTKPLSKGKFEHCVKLVNLSKLEDD